VATTHEVPNSLRLAAVALHAAGAPATGEALEDPAAAGDKEPSPVTRLTSFRSNTATASNDVSRWIRSIVRLKESCSCGDVRE
jgi:hypothetical protein